MGNEPLTELEILQHSIELLKWIFGAVGAVAAFLFGIWWKIESRQDKKIDDLAKTNHESHMIIHKKIDLVEHRLSAQHAALYEKTNDIWKHMKREN